MRYGREVSEMLAGRFTSMADIIDRLVIAIIDWHADNQNLLIGKGSYEAANECERVITTALLDSARQFQDEITHPNPAMGLRFVLHVLFASGVRNRLTDPALKDRFIAWPTLSDELRVFAKRYLCAPDLP